MAGNIIGRSANLTTIDDPRELAARRVVERIERSVDFILVDDPQSERPNTPQELQAAQRWYNQIMARRRLLQEEGMVEASQTKLLDFDLTGRLLGDREGKHGD